MKTIHFAYTRRFHDLCASVDQQLSKKEGLYLCKGFIEKEDTSTPTPTWLLCAIELGFDERLILIKLKESRDFRISLDDLERIKNKILDEDNRHAVLRDLLDTPEGLGELIQCSVEIPK